MTLADSLDNMVSAGDVVGAARSLSALLGSVAGAPHLAPPLPAKSCARFSALARARLQDQSTLPRLISHCMQAASGASETAIAAVAASFLAGNQTLLAAGRPTIDAAEALAVTRGLVHLLAAKGEQ